MLQLQNQILKQVTLIFFRIENNKFTMRKVIVFMSQSYCLHVAKLLAILRKQHITNRGISPKTKLGTVAKRRLCSNPLTRWYLDYFTS